MYLVTYQTNPGDNDLDLWSRRSRDPRDWTATPVAVSVARNSHDSQPLALPDGTFVVVYSEQAGSAFDVRYRHSSDGASWSDASLVTNWPTQYDTQPHAVVGAGPSTVVLAWSHQDGDRPYVDHDVWVEPALDLDIQRQAPLHLPLGYSGGATR